MSERKNLAARAGRIGVSAIREMAFRGSKVPGAISLGQGIPDTKTPRYIRDGITGLLNDSDAINKYSLSQGLPELRGVVATYLSKKGGFAVDPDTHVCITAGAIEALAVAVSTLVEEGDEVVLLDPGYPPYIEHIAFAGGKAVLVPLQPDNGWKIDLVKLENAITPKTKLLILCNPSNPTGMILGQDELEKIAALSKKHGFFVIADQTYEFLVYESTMPPPLISYSSIRDRLLVVYSFSKEFSMTGWRCGYLYAPSDVMEAAMRVHDAFVLCAPVVSQFAALVALTKRPGKDPEGMHADLKEKRDLMCARLDKLSSLFSYTKPRGAYYVFAKYKKTKLNSRDFALKMLEEAKVVCVPGGAFGAMGEGHVRFSYGASKERLNDAFDRLGKWSQTL